MSSASSQSSECGVVAAQLAASTGANAGGGGKDYGGLDFKIIIDWKTGPAITVHIVAPTMQEKAAWTSDISQVGLIKLFLPFFPLNRLAEKIFNAQLLSAFLHIHSHIE